MELALNLGWLLLSSLLCAGCVYADRCGRLRSGLGVALGCSLLLALLLFPAISMTDDLQSSTLEAEFRVRALAADTSSAAGLAALPQLLLMALLCAGALARLRLLWLTLPRVRRSMFAAFHPTALRVRPPTRDAFALPV